MVKAGVEGKAAASRVLPRGFPEKSGLAIPGTQQLSKQHQPCPPCNNKKKVGLNDLIYVRYIDHVLFKNSNHSVLGPVLRETVGFLTKQTNDAIWILWDRSVKKSPDEQANSEAGLIILRSDIKEIRKIE